MVCKSNLKQLIKQKWFGGTDFSTVMISPGFVGTIILEFT
jgi:hypothetical protein